MISRKEAPREVWDKALKLRRRPRSGWRSCSSIYTSAWWIQRLTPHSYSDCTHHQQSRSSCNIGQVNWRARSQEHSFFYRYNDAAFSPGWQSLSYITVTRETNYWQNRQYLHATRHWSTCWGEVDDRFGAYRQREVDRDLSFFIQSINSKYIRTCTCIYDGGGCIVVYDVVNWAHSIHPSHAKMFSRVIILSYGTPFRRNINEMQRWSSNSTCQIKYYIIIKIYLIRKRLLKHRAYRLAQCTCSH